MSWGHVVCSVVWRAQQQAAGQTRGYRSRRPPNQRRSIDSLLIQPITRDPAVCTPCGPCLGSVLRGDGAGGDPKSPRCSRWWCQSIKKVGEEACGLAVQSGGCVQTRPNPAHQIIAQQQPPPNRPEHTPKHPSRRVGRPQGDVGAVGALGATWGEVIPTRWR